MKREVGRAIALLTCSQDNHGKLVSLRDQHVNPQRIISVSPMFSKLAHLMNSSDDLIQRFSAIAVGNLALSQSSHAQFLECKVLDAMISITANSSVGTTQKCIAFAWANFCSFPDTHMAVKHKGGIAVLVKLLTTQETETHHQAVAALRQLARTPVCRPDIVREGALPLLKDLTATNNVIIHRYAFFSC